METKIFACKFDKLCFRSTRLVLLSVVFFINHNPTVCDHISTDKLRYLRGTVFGGNSPNLLIFIWP